MSEKATKSFISVVLPTTGQSSFLEMALRSVLDQRESKFEMVVCNDAKDELHTDRVFELVNQMSDPRIRCIRTKKRGVSNARNEGIYAAAGAVIALIDDDDLWHESKLNKQLGLIECGEQFVIANYNVMLEQEILTITEEDAAHRKEAFPATLHCNFRPPSCWMFTKELFLETGPFNESYTHCEDKDFALRASKKSELFFQNEVLVSYRKHSESVSMNYSSSANFNKCLIDDFWEDFVRYPAEGVVQLQHTYKMGVKGELSSTRYTAISAVICSRARLAVKISLLMKIFPYSKKRGMKDTFWFLIAQVTGMLKFKRGCND